MTAEHDVAIVGYGPVGAMAANLAGRAGLSVLAVDRATDVFQLPRAIHFDAHIMRILQQAGLAEQMSDLTRTWRRSTFYGADGEPIRTHDWPTDKPYGWEAHYLFYQPELERLLREQARRYDDVDVRLGTELVAFTQDDDMVNLTVKDLATGDVQTTRARYLLGADGASSTVRTIAGIPLIDGDFDEPWLVVDLRCERKIGRPDESEMFCDPARPSTRVPGPGNHHRWEFMLLPGENPDDMARPESVAALLARWITMDEAEIIRASVYRFHSLVAQSWRDGRVFLVGDAAHQTPPFLGQGMCHGMRDTHNLITKIASLQGTSARVNLLDFYEKERRPHVELIIEMAVSSGREICTLDMAEAARRDTRMRADSRAGTSPRTTFQGMPPLSGGLIGDTPGAGELFPQPALHLPDGTQVLFDDGTPIDVVVVAVVGDCDELERLAAQLQTAVVGVLPAGAAPSTHPVTSSPHATHWFTQHAVRFAVLRPDRYVFGTATSCAETKILVTDLRHWFPSSELT